MAPSADDIRKTVTKYLEAVAKGTVDDVLALFANGAMIEDPVGTDPRTTTASIREFYAVVEPLEQSAELVTLRIAGNEAAFQFSLVTHLGKQSMELSPIDVMTFDDEGKILTMRAFWSQEDMITR
ncbi:MAG: SnoaL-like domain-containing protein [Rhodococcus sp.]|nr:SnoaL-like domain-containing protein [Rhodococcus sp. (in: high G+C Gram-positive bacteria)]